MVPFRPSSGRVAIPLRRRLTRRGLRWWAATTVLAVVSGMVVHAVVARATEVQAAWGTSRAVVVATRPIAPGDPLDGATVVRRLPVVALPAGALGAVADGAVASAPIGAGEVVTSARVAGTAASGPAGRLPAGTRAVVIPLEVAGLPVRPGDRVDLLASGSADADLAEPPAPTASGPVASRAVVVSASAEALVVAVSPSDAVAIAAALGRGPLIPALVSTAGG